MLWHRANHPEFSVGVILKRYLLALALVFLVALPALAQPEFRGSEIFPKEEFVARRAKLMAQIGDSVAIVLGTTEPPGEMPFRQNSQFFYLTGVAEPRAMVIIDGRTKKTTLFLTPYTEREEKSKYGPGLNPAADPAALGVDAIVPVADFAKERNGRRSPAPTKAEHEHTGAGRSRDCRQDAGATAASRRSVCSQLLQERLEFANYLRWIA